MHFWTNLVWSLSENFLHFDIDFVVSGLSRQKETKICLQLQQRTRIDRSVSPLANCSSGISILLLPFHSVNDFKMKTAAVLALFLASAAAFNAPFATRAVGAKKAPAKKAPAKKAAPVVSF